MDFVVIIYSLFLLFFLGYLVQRLLFIKADLGFPGNLATAFGIGCGVVYYMQLLCSFVFDISNLPVVYGILFLLLAPNLKYRRLVLPKVKKISIDVSFVTLFLMFLVLILYEITGNICGMVLRYGVLRQKRFFKMGRLILLSCRMTCDLVMPIWTILFFSLVRKPGSIRIWDTSMIKASDYYR